MKGMNPARNIFWKGEDMRNKLSSVLWGIFLLIIGLGIGGNVLGIWNFELFFKGWWTLFILVPCVISILQDGLSIGNGIGLFIGILLLLNQRGVVISAMMWKLLIPGIFIIIGCSMVFGSLYSFEKGKKVKSYQGTHSCNAIFSGRKEVISDRVFEGIEMNAIFGGVTLDLKNAAFTGDVAIDATAVFGGIDILVPEQVNVRVHKVSIFGGTSNARRAKLEGVPTIYVNTVCMFGGVDIK